MAIDIFTGDYFRIFLHQLVSSQLDEVRLVYLRRDSFFSGVAEGMIGHERIIKMMNVKDDSLVIEEKGIYSVEKFLISRRLMYWQVYLHKTVIAAEQLLVEILGRARELKAEGAVIPGSPSLIYFLEKTIEKSSLSDPEVLNGFAALDDSDVMSAIKQWRYADDRTLSLLCRMLVERRLPAILLSKEPFDGITFEDKIKELVDRGGLSEKEARYFVKTGEVQNRGYDREEENIQILSKIGATGDIYEISDMLSAKAFSQITKKYFLCTPKKYYF
jgi:HD superfamily phosphohydrolase